MRPDKLFATLTIYVSDLPAPHKDDKFIKRPRLGHRYSFADLNYLVMDAARKVTAMYPKWAFRMIRLQPDKVRFIYTGERKPEVRPVKYDDLHKAMRDLQAAPSLMMANGQHFKLLAEASGYNPADLRDIHDQPLDDRRVYYLTADGYFEAEL